MNDTATTTAREQRAAAWARVAIPELDGLRGVAILLVYLFHAHGFVVAGAPVHSRLPLHLIFIYGGHTGVSLFFVLSAYLLSRPFLASLDGAARPETLRFYRRRALRILPLYWLAVVATVATSATSWADMAHAFPYFAFLQSVPNGVVPIVTRGSVQIPISTPWWSLATEAQFYALLPLLGLWTGPPRRRGIGILLAATAAALWGGYVIGLWSAPSFAGQWLLGASVVGRLPIFAAGIAVAWLDLRHGRAFRERCASITARRPTVGDAAYVVAALGLAISLRWSFYQGPLLRELPPLIAWRAVEGLIWGGALLATLWIPSLGRRILATRWLGWLGIRSYSIYLLHCPIVLYGILIARDLDPIRFAGQSDATRLLVVALTAICLGLAALTYRFVEQPFLRLRA